MAIKSSETQKQKFANVFSLQEHEIYTCSSKCGNYINLNLNVVQNS